MCNSPVLVHIPNQADALRLTQLRHVPGLLTPVASRPTSLSSPCAPLLRSWPLYQASSRRWLDGYNFVYTPKGTEWLWESHGKPI